MARTASLGTPEQQQTEQNERPQRLLAELAAEARRRAEAEARLQEISLYNTAILEQAQVQLDPAAKPARQSSRLLHLLCWTCSTVYRASSTKLLGCDKLRISSGNHVTLADEQCLLLVAVHT